MANETIWKTVRMMSEQQGLRPAQIVEKLRGLVTAKQISAKKQEWKRTAYKTDSKYAKYHTAQYKKWRKAVLTRDCFKCIICKRGRGQVKALQADHVKSWSRYPALRFEVSNGRTLCLYHHKRTLNYGYKANKCDDSMNGRAWEFKEKILWKKKQLLALQKKIDKR